MSSKSKSPEGESPEQRALRKAQKRLRRAEREIATHGDADPKPDETSDERSARKDRKRVRRAAEAEVVLAEEKVAALNAEKPKPAKTKTPPKTAIVVVAKNEGVYLHEWLAYNRLLGFDEILLYDNDSTDGSTELLSELAGHGLVTPVQWHVGPDVSPQIAGYEDALERLGEDFGWVAFIDLDEFLVLPQHETIGDFMAEFSGEHALGVNWKNFGSSGHEDYEPGLVIDRFRRCSEESYGRNRRVKVFADVSTVGRPGVHAAKLKRPTQYKDVNGVQIRNGRSTKPNLDLIRLNHYYTKSVEEWKWKLARGRGGKPENLGERKHWYPDFETRDRNEDEEVDIVKRLPELRKLIEETPVTTEVELPPAERKTPTAK